MNQVKLKIKVADSQGEVLSSTIVTLENKDTNQTAEAIYSEASNCFIVEQFEVGNVIITTQCEGFETQTRECVILRKNRPIHFHLGKVGSRYIYRDCKQIPIDDFKRKIAAFTKKNSDLGNFMRVVSDELVAGGVSLTDAAVKTGTSEAVFIVPREDYTETEYGDLLALVRGISAVKFAGPMVSKNADSVLVLVSLYALLAWKLRHLSRSLAARQTRELKTNPSDQSQQNCASHFSSQKEVSPQHPTDFASC
jgi:hypothetical protein